eukprot:356181-Chlamydomonas_euryale.AAC.2
MLDAIPAAALADPSAVYGLSFDASKLRTVVVSLLGVLHTRWPSCERWVPSSAWWLSMSAGLGTTTSGLPYDNASKMEPEPAWLMTNAADSMSSRRLGVY